MNRSRSVLGALGHPLLLALVGALFTVWFGPYVARQWQNHDRELEIQDQLAQQMTTATAVVVSTIQTYEFRPGLGARAVYVASYPRWDRESQAIGTKLVTYIEDGEQVRAEWREFSDRLLDLYNLADAPRDRTTRKEILGRLAAYLGRERVDTATLRKRRHRAGAYQVAWRELKYALLDARDAIQRRMLTSDVEL